MPHSVVVIEDTIQMSFSTSTDNYSRGRLRALTPRKGLSSPSPDRLHSSREIAKATDKLSRIRKQKGYKVKPVGEWVSLISRKPEAGHGEDAGGLGGIHRRR